MEYGSVLNIFILLHRKGILLYIATMGLHVKRPFYSVKLFHMTWYVVWMRI